MATSHNGTDTSVQVGAAVMSADGKRLGVVKEARVDRFLVDVRWAPDYWLGSETIDYDSEDLVQLIITKEAVGSAKLRNDVTAPEGLGGPVPANRPPPSI